MLDQGKLGTGKLVTVEELAKMRNGMTLDGARKRLVKLGIQPEVPAQIRAGIAAKYSLDKINARVIEIQEEEERISKAKLEKEVAALSPVAKELTVNRELAALADRDDDWAIEQEAGVASQMIQQLLQRQSRMRDKIQIMQEDL